MIFPDVNLLIYAFNPAGPQHADARQWLVDIMSGTEEVGLTDLSVFGFIRIATNRRAVVTPLTPQAAIQAVEGWLERPQVRFVTPGPRHVDIAFGLLKQLGTAGNLTTDAQLAAFAIEHQGEVHSNDADFARFPGLRWTNPLTL
jgi:toxin-antitoxin system PIN domain toxin